MKTATKCVKKSCKEERRRAVNRLGHKLIMARAMKRVDEDRQEPCGIERGNIIIGVGTSKQAKTDTLLVNEVVGNVKRGMDVMCRRMKQKEQKYEG